jgi:hypothetical protein
LRLFSGNKVYKEIRGQAKWIFLKLLNFTTKQTKWNLI